MFIVIFFLFIKKTVLSNDLYLKLIDFIFMYNFLYIIIFGLFCLGLFSVIVMQNKIKKLLFLGLMQTSVIMLYVASGYKMGKFIEPVLNQDILINYVNPVPHVLMLTAIVVGVAVSAIGLSMVIKINQYQSK